MTFSTEAHSGLHQPAADLIKLYFCGRNEAAAKRKLDKIPRAEEDLGRLVEVVMKRFAGGSDKVVVEESDCGFPFEKEVEWLVAELKDRGVVVTFTRPEFASIGPITALQAGRVIYLTRVSEEKKG